jgi:hypothetical protein
LKEGSPAAMIGCANLRMKQGQGDDYIPVSLTSSNSGWHKGWFYLQNDPEFALPAYTRLNLDYLFLGNGARKRGLLTVYMRIMFRLDLQADKSSIIVKGPFFP